MWKLNNIQLYMVPDHSVSGRRTVHSAKPPMQACIDAAEDGITPAHARALQPLHAGAGLQSRMRPVRWRAARTSHAASYAPARLQHTADEELKCEEIESKIGCPGVRCIFVCFDGYFCMTRDLPACQHIFFHEDAPLQVVCVRTVTCSVQRS